MKDTFDSLMSFFASEIPPDNSSFLSHNLPQVTLFLRFVAHLVSPLFSILFHPRHISKYLQGIIQTPEVGEP